MTPRLSVIMPSRNAGPYLDAALRSIRQQQIAVHEVLLIDGGSTDDTLDIAAAHRRAGLPLQILQIGEATPAIARNKGIAAAGGELIAFLDADDLWPADKLARQVARLGSEPRLRMVSGYVRYFESASADGLQPEPGSRTETLFHVHVGSCVYRRDVFDEIGGGFDESLLYSEDVDLMLRVREAEIPFSILRCVVLYYRLHPGSMMSQTNPRKDADFRRATHKSLVRRRARGLQNVPLPDFATFLEPET